MTTAARILELAHSRPTVALTPAEIVVRLGVSECTAYKTLQRMRQCGKLVRASYGAYHLPGAKVPPRPAKMLWTRVLELELRLEKIADSITSRAVLKVDGPARAAMLEIADAIRSEK